MKEVQDKIKIILDTDPGVDDSAALIMAFFEPRLDIKLITTVSGNRTIDVCTRNVLHLMEKFKVHFPVAKGAEKPLTRRRKDAAHIHGEEGMGTYQPSAPKIEKCLDGSVEDNMYKVIKENPHEIVLVLFGPQTNAGLLLKKYPDVANLLKEIVFMGGSPYGYKNTKPHISFNISSDPEAVDLVLKSGVKVTMIPSELGRRHTHLTYEQVMELKELNDAGEFLYEMYQDHWEPGFPDKRVATNDTTTLLYLTHPKLFKVNPCNIVVDLEDTPGKTIMTFLKEGNHNIAMKANGRKSYKIIKNFFKTLNGFDFY